MLQPKRYGLTQAQRERIAPMLPGKRTDPGRIGGDKRLFLSGCLWVLRSGAHWRDLPEGYGKWKTLHKRFTRWAKAGVWDEVFASLTRLRQPTQSNGRRQEQRPGVTRRRRDCGRGRRSYSVIRLV